MPKKSTTESPHIRNYEVGAEGVDIVTDPLHLSPKAVTQAQNAEMIPDATLGGKLVLSKRGGLAVLNGSALAGSVLGLLGLALKTSYTRTLYAARGTEDSNTFARSTNGTSWTDTSSPTAQAQDAIYGDNTNVQTARRIAAIRNFLVYPGNNFTQDTDNPTVVMWDGTNAATVVSIPIGPSSNGNPPFCITDTLCANGTLYLAISDPGGSAPDRPGRVLALDFVTGRMYQVASAFGGGSNEVSGGAPACLAFYQGQLWVGLNGENTTDAIGKIVRCHPGVDTSWTTDVANLRSHITSMCVFKGDLYATTRSSVSAGSVITQRSRTAGTWTTRATGAGGAAGSGHYAALVTDGSTLYAAEYHSTTPIIHIVSSTDGTTWGTSRDVDANDSGVAGNLPGGSKYHGSAIYFGFRSTTASGVNGFIMRLASGTWTKVLTDNLLGSIEVLTERS